VALRQAADQVRPELRVAVAEGDRLARGLDGTREGGQPRLVRIQARDAREPEVGRQLCSGDPGLVARNAWIDQVAEIGAVRRS
jgi:hypothetical protein